MNCRQIVTLFCAAAGMLRADVTLRYTSDFSIPESLPAQFAEPLRKSMEAQTAAEMSVRLKADKGAYKSRGTTMLIDFKKEEVTLLDTAGKRFGTIGMKDYPAALAAAMPQMSDQVRQTLAKVKWNIESSKSAKTETVQGIEGHTREVMMAMDGPTGMMKMTMHIVSAGADQAVKFPAIWEFNGYLAWSVRNMNPVETMRPIFAMMPGVGDGLAKLIEDGAKEPALLLKTEFAMSMSMLGTEPVMHLTQTLTEISTAPVDDAVFQIPTGYNEATVSEIMQAYVQTLTKATAR